MAPRKTIRSVAVLRKTGPGSSYFRARFRVNTTRKTAKMVKVKEETHLELLLVLNHAVRLVEDGLGDALHLWQTASPVPREVGVCYLDCAAGVSDLYHPVTSRQSAIMEAVIEEVEKVCNPELRAYLLCVDQDPKSFEERCGDIKIRLMQCVEERCALMMAGLPSCSCGFGAQDKHV